MIELKGEVNLRDDEILIVPLVADYRQLVADMGRLIDPEQVRRARIVLAQPELRPVVHVRLIVRAVAVERIQVEARRAEIEKAVQLIGPA